MEESAGRDLSGPLIGRALKRGARLLTGPLRLMPDFLIIGAQRAGTTSLFNYLSQHPSIIPALTKEVHFFDINYSKGLKWYRSHFPTTFTKTYVNRFKKLDILTGEATPYYLFHPHAPQRIFDCIPEVKLIVLLRNPIDRAYSHYQKQIKHGRETLPFDMAIREENKRLEGEAERIFGDERYYSFNHQRFSYLSRGIYVEQLRAWFDFFPRDRFLILSSKDLLDKPQAVSNRVFEFLDLPTWEISEHKRYNVIDYQKMDPSVRHGLIEYFRPYNQQLYEYLGIDFGWDV